MRSTLSKLLLLTLACIAFAAEAKQCIWNKSGFVVRVDWYRPKDLGYEIPDFGGGRHGSPTLEAKGLPVQADEFPLGQGRCTATNDVLTAVIYAVGSEDAKSQYASGTQVAAKASGAPVTLPCSESRCAVQFNDTMAVSRAIEAAKEKKAPYYSIPREKAELIITPPTNRYIDMSGTIFNPAYGLGGPI